MVEDATARPTLFLIREYYRSRGYFDWDARRFQRLCAKLNETPGEVATRAGMDRKTLHRRLNAGRFTDTEAILLTMIEQSIDAIKAGLETTEEARA